MLPADRVSAFAREVLSGMDRSPDRSLLVGPNGQPIESEDRLERLGYEGAKRGRRTDGWITTSTSANQELSAGLHMLRDRSRDLIRNNPHASKCQRVFRSHTVNIGIFPISKSPLLEIWDEHSEYIDADGMSDTQGIISLSVGTIFESGEVLIRKRARRAEDGLPLPFQLQVLEPDHLDTAKNELLKGGGRIVMGIEFNAFGKRVAYWLFPDHPGDGFGRVDFTSRRVPAEQIIHCFDRLRPGQIRGVPWLAPSILPLRHVDDWVDADLMRKTVEACIVGVITRPQAPITGPGFGGTRKPQGGGDTPDLEMMEPGTFAYTRTGETVEFNDPKSATDVRFLDERLHAIAAGAGVPYEEMTGNLAQTNFASFRAGRLSFWAMIREFQHLTVIPQICRRIWRWHIEDALLVDRISRGDETYASWQPPKMPSVNPKQDSEAELLDIRMGGTSWGQYITGKGLDPDEQLTDIVGWNKKFDAVDVVLEVDPRKVARSGQSQQAGAPQGGDE